MADIFFSYSRSDVDRVKPLVEALEERGWSVWWDPDIHGGESWSDVIEAELKQARCVIVAWSAQSTKSEWVREEARMANRTRKLVPVLLDQMDPPFGFGGVQTVDLSAWERNPKALEFTRLCASVQLKLASKSDATKATPELALQAADPIGPEPGKVTVSTSGTGTTKILVRTAAASALVLLLAALGWWYYSNTATQYRVIVSYASIGRSDMEAMAGRLQASGWMIQDSVKEIADAKGKNEIVYRDDVLAAARLLEQTQTITSEPIALKKNPDLPVETLELWVSRPGTDPNSSGSLTEAFERTAPVLIRRLMNDFGLADFQAAGIVGNIAQETAGFTVMQELKPVSGRGGLGYLKWTG